MGYFSSKFLNVLQVLIVCRRYNIKSWLNTLQHDSLTTETKAHFIQSVASELKTVTSKWCNLTTNQCITSRDNNLSKIPKCQILTRKLQCSLHYWSNYNRLCMLASLNTEQSW